MASRRFLLAPLVLCSAQLLLGAQGGSCVPASSRQHTDSALTPTCSSNADCPAGAYCTAAGTCACTPSCVGNADCNSPNGVCVEIVADCGGGLLPSTECSVGPIDCTGAYLDAAGVCRDPNDQVLPTQCCSNSSGNASTPTCSSNIDCRPGAYCTATGACACAATCVSDADCNFPNGVCAEILADCGGGPLPTTLCMVGPIDCTGAQLDAAGACRDPNGQQLPARCCSQ